MRKADAAIAVLVLAACGGGHSPSAATPTPVPTPTRVQGWPAGTVLTVVSGETDEPVWFAQVSTGAEPLVTDRDGHIELPAALPPGAPVDVKMAYYLPRNTTVRTGETRLSLWPDNPQLPGDYSHPLVYTNAATGSAGEDTPLRRLAPSVHTVSVTASGDLSADGAAVQTLQSAAANITDAARGRLRYVVGGTGEVNVAVSRNHADPGCADRTLALARVWLDGSQEITRGEIVFCSLEASWSLGVASHELGHTYGLRHSSERNDLMYLYETVRGHDTFNAREILVMSLMAQRRGGNAWPDNERAATSSAARVVTIVD